MMTRCVCVYFSLPIPAAYSKRNNKAGGGRAEITPGSARADVTRARDQCWVGPGYRQPCSESTPCHSGYKCGHQGSQAPGNRVM